MLTSTGFATGGLPPLSYQLLWNGGGLGETTWIDLIGLSNPNLMTSFTHTGLTTGTMHKYKYLVGNEVGWSDASPIMTTYAGTEPNMMVAATTQIDTDVTQVKISWTTPTDNGGMSVTGFKVMIGSVNGNFYESKSTCNGSDPTIRDAATCNVPLLTLVGLPFLLKQGNIVKVKLIPVNLIGEGLPSAINSVGALVETVPSKPPVSPTKNPTTTQT